MSFRAELRDSQREISRFQLRLAVGIGFVLVLFGILLVRFLYLQVVRHDYYDTLAENNRISLVPIVPNRGLILDRNGVVLAHNFSGYTLEITPSKVADLEATHARAQSLNCLAPEQVHGASAGAIVTRPWGERSFYARDPFGSGIDGGSASSSTLSSRR